MAKTSKAERDRWLQTAIEREIERALNDESSRASTKRKNNLDRYNRELYGDEEEFKSSYVTAEVFETIEWALSFVLSSFVTNPRAVEFLPQSHDDKAQAALETDIANHYMTVENNGFMYMHAWIKDMLMYPNGYIKCDVEEKEEISEERISGLTIDALTQLEKDKNVEIVEADSEVVSFGDLGELELHEVRVRRKEKTRKICIKEVPPDEVLVKGTWTDTSLEDCPFVAHRARMTISELVQMGYDFDELKEISEIRNYSWNDERINRLRQQEDAFSYSEDDRNDPASRVLWVYDVSMLVDYDEDGVAERRRILMVGNKIMDNDMDLYQPIVSCSAILMSHTHIGMSLVDAIDSTQTLLTALTRELLDNTYSTNANRHFIAERLINETTVDQYADESKLVVTMGNPQDGVLPITNTTVIPEILEVIKHVREQMKIRTGVAPELTLDPSILQTATAGAFMGALNQASKRMEQMVRVIAEVGVKPLVQKVHYLLRMHINTPDGVEINGQWQEFDPRGWRSRTRMRANVGLGANNSDRKIELLRGILDMQKEALSQGLTDPAKIYNTLEEMIKAADVGDTAGYFTDPSQPGWKPPEPQPDPQAELFSAQAQAVQQEQQRKMQEAQSKSQAERERLQMDGQTKQQEFEIKRLEIELERAKFELDSQMRAADAEMRADTVVADLRSKNADVALKKAQAVKTIAETDNVEAAADKLRVETSDEVRAAEEILNEPKTTAK